MTRTVTIVGAGPGGLASAMLLARAGVRVRICLLYTSDAADE